MSIYCLLLLLTVSYCPSHYNGVVAVSYCLPWSLSVSHCLFQFQGVVAFLSLFLIIAGCLLLSSMVAGCLALTLPVPWSFWRYLTLLLLLPVSHFFFLVRRSCFSHCLKLFLAVSHYFLSEFLNVSHCTLMLLVVSHFLPQFYGVAACLTLSLLWLLAVSLSLRSDGVAACLSLPPMVVLTFSPVPWSCRLSLTISHDCWLSHTASSSYSVLLHFSHCLLWFLAFSLTVYSSAMELLSPTASHSCWMSLTVS